MPTVDKVRLVSNIFKVGLSKESAVMTYFFLLTGGLLSLRIIELNGGQSPLTYKRFQTLISRMEAVEIPAETITAEVMGSCTTPVSDDHDEKFGVPSLEELGQFANFQKISFKLKRVGILNYSPT